MPTEPTSDILIAVLIEETLDLEPTDETRGVSQALRRKIREEVREIEADGGVVHIPYEFADPEV